MGINLKGFRFHNQNLNHAIQDPQCAGPGEARGHVHVGLVVFLQRIDEVLLVALSIGDDNVIYRWSVNSNQATKWL
jgi:hypothetical protein